MFLILVDCEQDDKITTTSLHGRNYPRENKIFAKKIFQLSNPETLSVRQEKSFPTRENFYLFAQRPS